MGNNGEAIRRAVKWISDQRVEKPEANLMKLVDEASLRFDLSPLEGQTLMTTFVENSPKKEGS